MPISRGRPNIVLVLIDDMGWQDLGCYGSTFYETPNIDALAARGTRFTQAYAAAPVCSPTRASLMSGKYPARVGITQYIGGHGVGRLVDVPYFHGLPENEFSLARALREGGYRTWHVGKWHLGDARHGPERHGFDVNIGGCALGSPTTYFSPYAIPTLEDGPPGEYLTDRLTDEAIRLVETADERPFFLNLWHYAVHTPLEAPGDLIGKYQRKAAALGLDTHAIVKAESMSAWHLRGKHVERRTVQSDPAYAAMIENLDANIGRLVAALDAAGKLNETLIVFTSDNGGLSTSEGSPTCNAPLAEGKGWMQDGGVRVPFIACLPGVVPAAQSPLAFSTPDIYPTLLSAAGLPARPRQHVDGVDLWAQWRGLSNAGRGALFWHYPHYSNQGGTPGAAVREGDFKLIRWFEDGRLALFNLAEDIEERHDLSSERPDLVEKLGLRLDDWSRDVMALVPQPNPHDYFPPEGM
ncbi:sulfatase [Devosia nitrariae]|uniref:Sulfatase n=1 Tax=Devosia nitrariae TaxID=2071872 RepID=A0ABQ5W7M3_9HYPH|nr:sulfatase [Devosia nitrariae]GLQ55867.1 sulfatase [Devosia nitrariae]